jgi:hypothetical protein
MLYPTAGSRLFIADVSPYGGMSGGEWVEIGELEAIGFLGSQWDVVTADVLTGCGHDDGPGEIALKGVERRPEMPIIMGNDPTDPGQLLLWTALHSQDSFPFRLVLPDGVTTRSWSALVIRMGDVFDAANTVLKLQADLKPTSAIERG